MQTISSKIGNQQTDCGYDDDYFLNLQVNRLNETKGTLRGYDCPKCSNKGFVYVALNGTLATEVCDCMIIRNFHDKAKRSGLSNLLDKYTFDKYQVTEDWQKYIKDKATAFVNDDSSNWFFIGGQVGSGKSHICTAMANEYLKNRKAVVYIVWTDEIPILNSIVNNNEEYQAKMQEFKTAPVLYIDDFFRVEDGQKVTPAETKRAFELLNYRYNNPELITIISSQLTIREIIGISEAVGSRINELTKGYQINIAPDVSRNYRLR